MHSRTTIETGRPLNVFKTSATSPSVGFPSVAITTTAIFPSALSSAALLSRSARMARRLSQSGVFPCGWVDIVVRRRSRGERWSLLCALVVVSAFCTFSSSGFSASSAPTVTDCSTCGVQVFPAAAARAFRLGDGVLRDDVWRGGLMSVNIVCHCSAWASCAWKSTQSRSSSQREQATWPVCVYLLPSPICIERELSISQYRTGHRFIVPGRGQGRGIEEEERRGDQ